MPIYRNLLPGDPAPWFHARSSTRADFTLDVIGGRYIVLCFFAAADARGKSAVAAAFAERGLFDDENASFFGVSIDPADKQPCKAATSHIDPSRVAAIRSKK